YNPSYTMGYLGLAFCYFDLGQHQLAYATLRPLASVNRDNIRLQKIFAKICHEMGHVDEALETYKFLLFMNPRDQEALEEVGRLENVKTAPVLSDHPAHQSSYPEHSFGQTNNKEEGSWIEEDWFDIDKIHHRPHGRDRDTDDAKDQENEKNLASWKKVDWFVQGQEDHGENEHHSLEEGAKEPLPPPARQHLKDLIEKQSWIRKEDAFDKISTRNENKNETEDAPVITHTLVDLYCAQGHLLKAQDILKKILELNPNDQKTLKKMEEVKILIAQSDRISPLPKATPPLSVRLESKNISPILESENDNDEGRKKLMNLIDKKMKISVGKKKDKIEKQLNLFLNALQKKASTFKNISGRQ
ncbi:MAG: hypothetical protein WCG27_05215, partial [Pseudomonadota bacterium]